jgi:hypothetical protein
VDIFYPSAGAVFSKEGVFQHFNSHEILRQQSALPLH